MAEKWFTIAKNDRDIVQILLEQSYYAAATYHLQQAFEKLTKGYYIFSGRMEPEEASEHQFVLNRLKKEINDQYLNDLLKISEVIDKGKISLQASDKSLEIIHKSEESLRKLDKTEINLLITLVNNIEKKLLSESTFITIEKKAKERRNLNKLKHLIYVLTRFRVSSLEIKQAIEREQIIVYLNCAVTGIKLHIASIITFLHFNTPRYPNCKNSEINFSSYSQNMGIVEMIPDLTKLFDEIYDSIRIK